MMRLCLKFFLISFFILLASPILAVEPGEELSDPALEARAREISKGLRCLVCQNQTIDDSNADLARDLRLIVRERLRQGDSDKEVTDYVRARYGDFVLLSPPFSAATLLLWIGPFVFLLFAFFAWWRYYAGRRDSAPSSSQPPPLSKDDQARLKALLNDESEKGKKS
ncbi:MAG: cytochrome c-type biogenesis protein CcmH [Rhodospirillaceae bacterium]|jgi:cytochrome c-type biogenesis protein CcmH|nr:cytochrome c-type biogenesis protein CcmH [Rhodospirillaceae bacterium]MBT5375008.1 cytochrome c-type biogenesis protein CcmH [Rhodospirillaceae bacterium]MBT5751244.1 cytochrome c-type biogenesis protein CcmH [Rhodospirillaceae bacterium]